MIEFFPQYFPVACHTDYVGPGSIFVAIKGFSTQGASFIPLAIKRGARMIVVEDFTSISANLWQLIYHHQVIVQKVENARRALAHLSARAAKYPASKLKIIGITGTKGKTTTAHLLFHILQTAGISSALISSVSNHINNYCFDSSLTTPQPDYLHQFLRLCVEQGVRVVILEVAAHAISLHRIEGIQFDAVIITNIAREHLEFYESMEAYAQAKYQLLNYRKPGAIAWLNGDDERLRSLNARRVKYFGFSSNATMHAMIQDNAILFSYESEKIIIKCPQIEGIYNIANCLSAAAGAQTFSLNLGMIQKAFLTFPGVAGRGEKYRLPNGAMALIDYAHNPFSYQALFQTVRLQTDHLIIVFGAGGNRDRARRPEMGRIAALFGDIIIITSDNPRDEDPLSIAREIMEGIPLEKRANTFQELDRKKAIELAYKYSKKGSIIACVGKGPDEYQLIKNKKIPFSERAIIRSLG